MSIEITSRYRPATPAEITEAHASWTKLPTVAGLAMGYYFVARDGRMLTAGPISRAGEWMFSDAPAAIHPTNVEHWRQIAPDCAALAKVASP
jgi:hypothetical protein